MFSNPISITFIGYLVVMIAIGFIAWTATKNFQDFILGGRSLGSFVTGLSACASDMSGWLLMGLPGAVYLAGVCEAWMAIGLTIGNWFCWKFVAKRLRVYTERAGNALTLPNFFTHRFEDRSGWLRITAATVILLFFTIYSSSGIVASARLFENTFGLPYSTALWFGACATVIYVFIGGFLAVSWTDTIQAALMCGALIVTPIAVMMDLGGFSAACDSVMSIDPTMISLTKGQTFIGVVSLLAWGLGYCGQPHILVRFMAAKNASVMDNSRRWSLAWMVLSLGGAVLVGFFGLAYFNHHADTALAAVVRDNHERIFMALSEALFNPWFAGVLLSAILAAVMSTLSSQLLVCSSAITEDFYHSMVRKNASQLELVWFGRVMVLLVAFVALLIASDPKSLVLSLVSYAWAGFTASFGPVVVMSLWWKGTTRNGALAGMVTGATTVVVWHQFAWFGLYEIVPGFLFGLLAVYLFSHVGAKPTPTMAEKFDLVEKEARAA